MNNILSYISFILFGYLSGSILYADLIPKCFCNIDITSKSDDQNPGAFNAFKYAGWKIGFISIILELLKGFVPVYLASRYLDTHSLLFGVILAAPVLGHAFPAFNLVNGGKAIAVSFGCLLGLYPNLYPALLLAIFYLLFSFVIVICPHLHRSIATYLCFIIVSISTMHIKSILLGITCISCIVIIKHLLKYKKEPVSIRLLSR